MYSSNAGLPRKNSVHLNPQVWGRRYPSLFDELLSVFEPAPSQQAEQKGFFPRLELIEDDNSLVIRAEVPGLTENDIDITLTQTEVTLKGSRKEEIEQRNKDGVTYRSEWRYGSFERVIPLTFEVENDAVEATCKDGVLTLTLPKSRKALSETKKVSIKRA